MNARQLFRVLRQALFVSKSERKISAAKMSVCIIFCAQIGLAVYQLFMFLYSFRTIFAAATTTAITVALCRIGWKLFIVEQKPDEDDPVYEDGWYGRGPKPTSLREDTSIRPFTIRVEEDVLEDLKRRLENTRLAEPVEDVGFKYGFNPDYLRELVEYWKDKYDWRKHERDLNRYPSFTTTIEGIDVHFWHVKPENVDKGVEIVPLMILHGWPGCFYEFYKILPMLINPSKKTKTNFVFEIICPSIPGYTFSEAAHHPGMNSCAAGRIFVKLMGRLGHSSFFVQGGDWGSSIAINIARLYPQKVYGVHVNMFAFGLAPIDALKFLLVAFIPSLISRQEYKLVYPIKRKLKSIMEESGYFHIQATKPDTLGCGLTDSPAGMAAYLLEKFGVATNPEYVKRSDGGLTEKFTLDELLTICTLYWVTKCFTSAARFYKENIKTVRTFKYERIPVKPPAGIAVFPHEVLMYPKMMLTGQLKNIVSYTVMPRGGHFAALEEPELLAQDVLDFVDNVRKHYS